MVRKEWDEVKEGLPGNFEWWMKEASKSAEKGRAKDGMIVGRRKGMKDGGAEFINGGEGLMWARYGQGGRSVNVGVLYANKNWTEIRQEIEERTGGGDRWVIGGDFNARVGEMGGGINEEGEVIKRKSQDKSINGEGKRMKEWVMEGGWEILNGCTEGDWEGKKTYIGPRGSSVIDYVTTKGLARGEVKSMEVEEYLGSDHLPLKVEIRIGKEKGKERVQESVCLESEAKAMEEMTRRWEDVKTMEEMKGIIVGCGRRVRGERGRRNEWFDEECRQAKREMRIAVRECIRSGGEERRVVKARKKFEDICEIKKRKAVEKAGEELSKCKNEGEMWSVLRRGEERKMIGVSLEDWARKCREGSGEPKGIREMERGERGEDFKD